MVLREIDDLPLGKHLLHFLREVLPLERTVEVVEERAAAAQQELAQDLRVAVGQREVARLDEVDPRVLEEAWVVEREHDRVEHVDGGGGLDAARQVLFGGRSVDEPGLAVELELLARGLGVVVVLDADEAPLQAGEAVIGGSGQLGVHLRLQGRDQGECEHGCQREQPALAGCHGRASASFNSRSCARS